MGLDAKNQEGNNQKQTGGRRGTRIGNFDLTYFFNEPLVGLTFVMVEDGDCHGDCYGIE